MRTHLLIPMLGCVLCIAMAVCGLKTDVPRTWQVLTQDQGPDSLAFFAITFASPAHGWALTPSELLETTDGGKTWKKQLEAKEATRVFYSFALPGPTTAFIVGTQHKEEGYLPLVLRSDDGGSTWQESTVSVPPQPDIQDAPALHSVDFCDQQTGWAVGNNLIVHTVDSGRTWETKSWGKDEVGLLAVKCLSAESAWAVGRDGLILHTADGGRSWQHQDGGGRENLVRVRFFDDTGWVVGGQPGKGVLLRTHNGGETWDRVQIDAENLFDIYINGRQGWAVGAQGTMVFTADGGQTWEKHKSPTDNDLITAFFLDAHQGWVGGNRRTILKYSE